MVYYVSGTNIFGQWFEDDLLMNEFRPITDVNSKSLSKIIKINWSYNILVIDNLFYLSGAWEGKIKQLIELPLPANYTHSEELIVTGNDHNLLFISMHTSSLCVMDLNLKSDIKNIHIDVEQPKEKVTNKQIMNETNSKVVLCNDSCLFLTSLGNVYCGILPTYVDTRHCKGDVCDIQCGYEHYVLLTNLGAVYTWGNGRRLQLGHGDIANIESPQEVEALAGIKIIKINCGGWHTLALSEFGDLYAWGWNDTGQLGIANQVEESQSYSIPTLVELFESNGEEITLNVKEIGCGSRHSAIVLENNTVWTTGCNKYGQLGFSPEQYPSINTFKMAFHCDNISTLKCGPWTTVVDTTV